MLHAGGAKSKQPNYNQQKQYPQTEKERRNDKEGNSQIRHHQQGHNRQPFKKYLLNFNGVKKMMEENTEPHIVVKKFAKETTGLEFFKKQLYKLGSY
jgi:hypothetical protein